MRPGPLYGAAITSRTVEVASELADGIMPFLWSAERVKKSKVWIDRGRAKASGLGKVDVIPTYTLEGQGLKITQALAQAGVTKGGGGNAIQIGTIWLPFGFEAKAGKAALGYIRIVQFDPTDTRDVAKNFASAFKAKNNADPTHLNAHAYDQIMLIADVVKRGGKDAQSIRDGLAATKNYSGVTGSVEFDKTNQNTKMDTIHYMETKPDMSWTSLKWN